MQFRFIKYRDLNNKYDTITVDISSDASTVSEILEDFRAFLLACGYQIKGDLIVEATEEE